MEVTLQDIADKLHVSATTVSRSLRHDKMINPETRARSNEVARSMGYQTRARRPRRNVESDTEKKTLGLLVRFNNLAEAQLDSNLMKMMAGTTATISMPTMSMSWTRAKASGAQDLAAHSTPIKINTSPWWAPWIV